jgi:hypothetical protein
MNETSNSNRVRDRRPTHPNSPSRADFRDSTTMNPIVRVGNMAMNRDVRTMHDLLQPPFAATL